MRKITRNFGSSPFLLSLVGFWKEFKNHKPGYIGIVIMATAILIGLLAPYISPYNPRELEFDVLESPSFNHPMGTDYLGRDMLSRVIHGISTSLMIGIGATALSTILGVILGAIPGYLGGKIDVLFSRVFEIFMMIPTLLLLILAAALMGSNINNIMILIGITTWPAVARIMRSQVLTLKTREYVESSIAIGGGGMYTLFRHIVPNGLYPVITVGTMSIGGAILMEAALSFLGLGDPSAISLGKEIRMGVQFMPVTPYYVTFPGIILIILVLAFNMIGDGLNSVFNPRLKRR